MILPTLLLAELAASISRVRRDPIRARVTIEALQSLPFITFIDLDRALGQAAADIAADRAVKGADAVYAVQPSPNGMTGLSIWRRLLHSVLRGRLWKEALDRNRADFLSI